MESGAPALPPFVEHASKGAMVGAVFGAAIAAVGWIVRRRNAAEIDLGADAPHLLAKYRHLADALLPFKEVSSASPTAEALYIQMVNGCEFVASNDSAAGGQQIQVQKRVTQTLFCAKQLAAEAFRARHPHCHECKMQVEVLQGLLGGIQKNMMMH